MRKDIDPPAIVRPAETRAARVKRLHGQIAGADRDNLARAIECGKELCAEREACTRGGRPWIRWVENDAGIPRRTAADYMDVAKAYAPGGLLADSANLGLSESLEKIRAHRYLSERPPLEAVHGDRPPVVESGEVELESVDVAGEAGPMPDIFDAADAEPPDARTVITLDDWNDMHPGLHQVTLGEVPDGSRDRFNEQGDNENIEWALWSWNPVTGCLHNCPYCYARDIADRFYGQGFKPSLIPSRLAAPENTPFPEGRIAALPAGDPRRLGFKNVFTCSMADLFGRWVPREWIAAVLERVADAGQWNFLFLTKFPARMAEFDFPKNAWVGTTVDCQARVANAEKAFRKVRAGVKWLSIEPLIEPLHFSDLGAFQWVVLGGASRSSQTPEWRPPRDWVDRIEAEARRLGVPFYEKTNLRERIRSYPGGPVYAEPKKAPPALHYLPEVG
jgi:protein gp37